MTDESKKLLLDVKDAAAGVLQYTAGLTLERYAEWRLVRRAVEREFEIIGEALNRLRRIDAATAEQLPEAQKIIAFRNRVIHGYDTVEDAITWGIIEGKLPDLLSAVSRLLDDDDGSQNI